MVMAGSIKVLRIASLALVALIVCLLEGSLGPSANAQTRPRTTRTPVTAEKPDRARLDEPQGSESPSFGAIYQRFFKTYKLGGEDELAIHVMNEPDYSIEKVKISPLGTFLHPLLGNIEAAGLTVPQLTSKLTAEFGEYIKNPRVSVALLTAQSAKIGVLGEVNRPGIVLMTGPMKLLDAISASGGFTDFGSKSNVTVIRQGVDGSHPEDGSQRQADYRGEGGPDRERRPPGRGHGGRRRKRKEDLGVHLVGHGYRWVSQFHQDRHP